MKTGPAVQALPGRKGPVKHNFITSHSARKPAVGKIAASKPPLEPQQEPRAEARPQTRNAHPLNILLDAHQKDKIQCLIKDIQLHRTLPVSSPKSGGGGQTATVASEWRQRVNKARKHNFDPQMLNSTEKGTDDLEPVPERLRGLRKPPALEH